MSQKNELINTFHRIHQALMSGDTEVIADLYAEDYRGFNVRGGVDNRELILQVFAPGQVELQEFDISEMKVDNFGDVGMITGVGKVSGKYQNEEFQHNIRFIDVFVYRDSRWQYYFSQATEILGT